MTRKEKIILEFHSQGTSYRQLSAKYGVATTTVFNWIKQSKEGTTSKEREKTPILPAVRVEDTGQEPNMADLQRELAQEKLKNKLLNTMIDIAEAELRVSIRKKSGTKQSKK